MCLFRIVREGMGSVLRICWSIESGQDIGKRKVMGACSHKPSFSLWPMRRKPRNCWRAKRASSCSPDGVVGGNKEATFNC